MTVSARRTQTAYLSTNARQVDYTRRASLTRAAGIGLVALGVVTSQGPGYAWLLLLPPLLGTYLSWASARALLRNVTPREPLAAWATRVGDDAQGRLAIDVSGTTEAIGVLLLLVLCAFGLSGTEAPARLVVTAGAAIYVASWLCAVFVDVAWYNPDEHFPPPLEWLRAIVGPVGALILAGALLPTARTNTEATSILLLALAVASTQVRIRETDRLLAEATMVAGDAELKGRTYVTCELHTLMGNPMLSLRRELFRGRAAVPDAFDSFRQVDAALRETLMLDWSNAVTVDWPGTLFGSLRQIQGAFGCRIAFDAPEVLSMADRAIARLVLDDLARNAAAAGSSRVHLSLSINGEDWVVEAFDDAPCFLPGQWLQIGGGLERLARRLATSSGGLRLVEYEETQGADGWTKCVVAQWTSHREAKGQG